MFSRYPFLALVSLTCVGAALSCSAQGDQTDTGLDPDDGNGNGGNGAVGFGGTSSSGDGGTIIVSGTGSGAAAGTGGTQGGVMCAGNGARLNVQAGAVGFGWACGRRRSVQAQQKEVVLEPGQGGLGGPALLLLDVEDPEEILLELG